MNAARVEVWVARLDLPAVHVSGLSGLLSPDEKTRASGFVVAEARNRFIAGRAFLRMLLGDLLSRDPVSLRFQYGRSGKPALDRQGSGLDFNLSHAGTVAAVAVSGVGEVGVDVEWIRPLDDLDGVVRAAFPAREAAQLLTLPPPARLESFYRAWTRKEAALKASGSGLGGEPADGLGDEREVSHFEVGAGYVGAVAGPGVARGVRAREWTWPPPESRSLQGQVAARQR